MKNHPLNLVIGSLLLLLFLLLLFLFQVRQTQVAVVSTFGKATRPITEPGLYFKWPWPIQKVTKLDKRLHSFESKFEETLTADGRNLLIMVYVAWSIDDPALFYTRFASGSLAEAERTLDNIVRTAKNAAVGRHPLADFVAANPEQLKLALIEGEILGAVTGDAQRQGIGVKLVGIKRLGLPESVTEKVFDRMRAERTKEVERLRAEGQEQAMRIRTDADLKRDEILAAADAEATRIRGEGMAKAAESFAVFRQNPDLANLILKLNALETTLKERTTLIVDPRMPPFDLLINPTDKPASGAEASPPNPTVGVLERADR